ELAVYFNVAGHVGAGQSQFAGVGEKPSQRLAAQDLESDVVGRGHHAGLGDAPVVRLDAKGQLVVEYRSDKSCHVHGAPFDLLSATLRQQGPIRKGYLRALVWNAKDELGPAYQGDRNPNGLIEQCKVENATTCTLEVDFALASVV